MYLCICSKAGVKGAETECGKEADRHHWAPSDYKELHLTCRVALGLHPGTRITLRTAPLKIACKRLDPDPDPVPPAAEGVVDEAVGPPT